MRTPVQAGTSRRQDALRIAALLSGVAAAGLFLIGLGNVYGYHKHGECPVLLGWWSIGAALFWPALFLSVIFWACLVLSARRFRGAALFGAGLAVGLWLWFGGTSAVEQSHLQRAYRVQYGIAAAAPLPDWANSTNRDACGID